MSTALDPEVLRVDREQAEPQRRGLVGAPRWLWVAAAAVLVPVFVPMAFLLGQVLTSGGSAWSTLLSGRTAWLVARSLAFTAAVSGSAAAIGVAAAWATERTDLAARRAWVVAISLPLVVPSYVLALSYLSFFGPRGLFADTTGVALPSISGAGGAWLALTISTYPYVYLLARAGLRRIDPALEDAARSLGAGPWRRFRTVTLPQLRPAIAAGTLLAALYTLSDFGAVSLMRFDVFTRVIYAQYQGRIDRTPAAVLSLVLVVVALVVIGAEQRARGRARYYTRTPQRPARDVRLAGATRAFTVGGLGLLVTVGLVLPIGVLVSWLGRGIAGHRSIEMQWGAVTGSLSGSIVAAGLALAASIPIVVLTVRHPGRASSWLRRSVLAIFSLPHIAVAVAVVFFGARYLGPAYQSFAVLTLVYATIFLAQATNAGEAALVQVNPHLEDAARSLGKSPARTLRDVTVPLMWRGLLAGAALVFLTTMKELPATLLLRPTGFDTLAVRIWSTTADLFYARAAAPALLLVAVSALPMYLLVIRSDR